MRTEATSSVEVAAIVATRWALFVDCRSETVAGLNINQTNDRHRC
jgi:hypothetical protein